jgi:hypothetical protein
MQVVVPKPLRTFGRHASGTRIKARLCASLKLESPGPKIRRPRILRSAPQREQGGADRRALSRRYPIEARAQLAEHPPPGAGQAISRVFTSKPALRAVSSSEA